jgi:hypothetical protein
VSVSLLPRRRSMKSVRRQYSQPKRVRLEYANNNTQLKHTNNNKKQQQEEEGSSRAEKK